MSHPLLEEAPPRGQIPEYVPIIYKITYKFGRYDVPDVFEILDLLVWVRNNTLF